MAEQFANHPGTTLSAAITSTTRPVTFSVASVANLPTQGNFRVLIDAEILLITTVSGTSLTGSNVEGTTAATHVSGANVLHILTAGALVQLEADVQSATQTALLATSSTFTGNPTFSGSPLLSGNPNFSGNLYLGGANSFWLQPAGSALYFNAYFSSGWNQTANIAASNGWWNFQQGVNFVTPANISFGSNWLTWTPTVTASGSMTVSSVSFTLNEYLRIGPLVFFQIHCTLTLGGTLSSVVYFTVPVSMSAQPDWSTSSLVVSGPSTGLQPAFGWIQNGTLSCGLSGLVNYPAAGSYTFVISGFYRCA